jgi:predicted PurR-regulated permease PerM
MTTGPNEGDTTTPSDPSGAATTTGAPGTRRPVPDAGPAPEPMPTWTKPVVRLAARELFWALVLSALAVGIITYLAGRLSGFLTILFMALFLSFAIEPAVDWFASRGMRRGYATALVFFFILLALVGLIALIVPAIVQGFQQAVQYAPQWIDTIVRWLRRIGIDVSGDKLITEIQKNAQNIASYAADFAGNIFGIGASILGAIFRWATIALFTFYFVAEGPKMRRVICSALPPARQEEMLFIWNQAVEKTGGYFYSRLLLAVINGTGMYITLRIFNVPFAAPLAVFEGVVAAFIPIIGTYLAGIPPVLVALLTSPAAGIASLAYILIYQQIENYFLSPRLTAKTMALHPAVAFAAALIGGALGGLLAAFLALPVAGVFQAAVQAYGKRYQVVDNQLTEESPEKPEKPSRTIGERLRSGIHRDQPVAESDDRSGGEDLPAAAQEEPAAGSGDDAPRDD